MVKMTYQPCNMWVVDVTGCMRLEAGIWWAFRLNELFY
jgi:hypothetical protein